MLFLKACYTTSVCPWWLSTLSLNQSILHTSLGRRHHGPSKGLDLPAPSPPHQLQIPVWELGEFRCLLQLPLSQPTGKFVCCILCWPPSSFTTSPGEGRREREEFKEEEMWLELTQSFWEAEVLWGQEHGVLQASLLGDTPHFQANHCVGNTRTSLLLRHSTRRNHSLQEGQSCWWKEFHPRAWGGIPNICHFLCAVDRGSSKR